MEVLDPGDGIVVINDAYNANPESVRAALKALAAIGRARPARTVAVLGEMAELGPDAAVEHDAIGRLAREAHLVRDDDHRRPHFERQRLHDVEHFADHLGIESARGLVEEHQRRLHSQRARDCHALLLTPG